MSFTGRIRRGPIAADVVGRHYTTVANAALRDRRLSRRARGLLAEILSHRDGHGISLASLVAGGPEGRDAIRSALAELERYGYLHRTRERDELGRLGDAIYEVTDMPDGLTIASPPPWEQEASLRKEDRRSEPRLENPTLDRGEKKPRSEPRSGFPTQAEPTWADPPHKKNSSPRKSLSRTSLTPDVGGEDTEEREMSTPPRSGGGGVPRRQVSPSAEAVAWAEGLPGDLGRQSVRRIAALAEEAVAEGWSWGALGEYLRSRVDVSRAYAPASLYVRHLTDRPAPRSGGARSGRRPAGPPPCPLHPGYAEGDCPPCVIAERQRAQREGSGPAPVSAAEVLARVRARQAAGAGAPRSS